ncbi:MAG: aspartate aminotransferase family protein [Candidatus Melainabacteria bacterium]|nr:aspartate aminotransferase family protein [Candidatus Melainabacteria bacterium]
MLSGKSTTIDRTLLEKLLRDEEEKFRKTHKQSFKLFEKGKEHLLAGVPMNWMIKWASPYPVYVKEAKGAHFTDVDGNQYVDLCLGDTGAMTGHSPDESTALIIEQIQKGITFMLPTENSIWVAEELTRRFGLKYWQFTLTATDANRFALRLARQITGRPYVLVFNWCYHGTVDESFITLVDGKPQARKGNCGPQVDPVKTTKVVEFNDIEALEKALASRDVACVLAEPVMTNIGIVHPAPGYLDALREITKRTGTLLIYDETHTICTGPGGYTGKHNLAPDMMTIGKPLGSGIPGAVYGCTEEVAQRIREHTNVEDCDTSGIGGTLAGNALSIAAMRATLEKVLTDAAYEKTIPLCDRFVKGVEDTIKEYNLPWIVKQLGCRAEYWFREKPPTNGGEAAAAGDYELDRYMHLAALNRGVLMTPFHNMALMSPSTSEADIDRHTEVFRESVQQLLGVNKG